MREEMVKLLQERVGLNQQQAEHAVDAILQYLQQHGPEVLRSLTGGQGGGPDLGKLFGR